MLYQLSYPGADAAPISPGQGERRVIEGCPHPVQKPEQPMETKV